MNHAPDLCPHCGAPSAPRLLVSHIQATVAAYYQIPVRHMTSERQDHAYSHPRQLAMYFAAELTPKSSVHIGKLFGGRDHSTVLFAIKAVQRRMLADAELAEDIKILRERLVNSPVDNGEKPALGTTNHEENAKEQSGNIQEERLAA